MTSMKDRRGASAVELALILPFLVLFMLGATDYGRFARVDISVEAAAGAGARKGADTPVTDETLDRWESAVRQVVVEEMRGLSDYVDEQLKVTATRTTQSDGNSTVKVIVKYPFSTMLKWPGIPKETTLTATATAKGLHP